MKDERSVRFLKTGRHTPHGIYFEVNVATAAYLFGCLERGTAVFAEFSENCESV